VENPSLDLETYSSAYTGLAMLTRLQFIAERCPVYAIEALKLAISHCQNTHNTALYQKLHRKLTDVVAGTANGQGGFHGGTAANIPDVADGVGNRTVPALELNWIDARNKKFQTKLEKLDNDLKNYKSNSIKESIRRGTDDLEVLQCFYDSRYGQCLKLLEEMKDNLMLDMYLAPHINTLFSMIRNRGLIQYFSPYSSADLNKMAQSFNTSLPDLENELMKLILEGSIQARIDSHNKVLLAQDVDQRSQVFSKAVEMCDMYQRRARMLLVRSAIMKAGISVKSAARENAARDQPALGSKTSDYREEVSRFFQQNSFF